MKNLKLIVLVFFALTFLNACSEDEEVINQTKSDPELFLKSVQIVPEGRISVENNQKSVRVFSLRIHDSKYLPLKQYSLNGELFTDDGSFYDQIAGDGVYTSTNASNESLENYIKPNYLFQSDKFNFKNDNYQNKGGVKVGCKIGHTRQGTTVLGFSCDDWLGCFYFYDYEVSVEIGW